MSSISRFEGLYGDRNARPDSEYVYWEQLETRSRHFEWDIKPHFHPRLCQLFFVEKGQFMFMESSAQQQLEGPCLILIPPASLHGFSYTTTVTGSIISLSDSLLNTLFPEAKVLAPMMGKVQFITRFSAPYTAQRVQHYMQAVEEELFDNQHQAEKRRMLHLCLQQLFLVLYRLWLQQEEVSISTDTISLVHFRKLQELIRREGGHKTVMQLAQDLHITPVHLNRICREIAGKAAGQLVQEHLLEEARKYLTYTSYSISEIAYLLHFEYPNYFARFFKKHTGLSPREYRDGSNEVKTPS
ncbi:helix-turn-helix domain-containing protein [Filimonas lacunae]|uniref:helix-turn-helix domain-containing protein n=1 Tax=Filimonas lacunae TaxID=477680 RepID=UPI0007D732B9|nr:helix-turn-helix domain-containing protein [Filimonas lacunae]BAV06196.1 transcriptional regulator, AraC family [Filimonas lacunae]